MMLIHLGMGSMHGLCQREHCGASNPLFWRDSPIWDLRNHEPPPESSRLYLHTIIIKIEQEGSVSCRRSLTAPWRSIRHRLSAGTEVCCGHWQGRSCMHKASVWPAAACVLWAAAFIGVLRLSEGRGGWEGELILSRRLIKRMGGADASGPEICESDDVAAHTPTASLAAAG